MKDKSNQNLHKFNINDIYYPNHILKCSQNTLKNNQSWKQITLKNFIESLKDY